MKKNFCLFPIITRKKRLIFSPETPNSYRPLSTQHTLSHPPKDFTRVNPLLEDYKFPLPRTETLINFAMSKKWFSTFDLTRGYWQAELDEDSKPLTAFTTEFGVYEWNRVPMGIHKSGPFFQAILQTHILRDVIGRQAVIYIDDLLVGSN